MWRRVLLAVTEADLELSGMRTLEHVAVTVTITHPRRGNLEIRLLCPSGMESLIGTARSMDSDPNGFVDWTFSTVRCWGEEAQGTYQLVLRDLGDEMLKVGVLQRWQLTLYGSSWTPTEIKGRQRLLEEAMSGRFLESGFSLSCPPGLQIPEQEAYTITTNTLKTLMLLGCFAVFWTIYYMLEVFLTRNHVALDLAACGRSSACPWYSRGRTARSLEDGTEREETVPLCGGKDLELEAEPASLGGQEEDKSSWSTEDHKPPGRERLAESPAAGSGHLTRGSLTSDRGHQAC